MARRKLAVANRSATNYPAPVAHALDFFIWSALEDSTFLPIEPRPFGDDERSHNAALNSYVGFEAEGTRTHTMPRYPEKLNPPPGAFYGPHYFPDDPPFLIATLGVSKHALVMAHLKGQKATLQKVAMLGRRLEAPSVATWEVAVCPDAYTGYYRGLLSGNRRFADAKSEEREAVCVDARRSAVLEPGTLPRITSGQDWRAVPIGIAEQVIADFLDPEAMGLWCPCAST